MKLFVVGIMLGFSLGTIVAVGIGIIKWNIKCRDREFNDSKYKYIIIRGDNKEDLLDTIDKLNEDSDYKFGWVEEEVD